MSFLRTSLITAAVTTAAVGLAWLYLYVKTRGDKHGWKGAVTLGPMGLKARVGSLIPLHVLFNLCVCRRKPLAHGLMLLNNYASFEEFLAAAPKAIRQSLHQQLFKSFADNNIKVKGERNQEKREER